MEVIMKRFFLLFSVILLFVMSPHTVIAQLQDNLPKVGVFDSRLLIIAYTRSQEFGKYISSLKSEAKKAKDNGDSEKALELELKGKYLQQLVHLQVFSNASAKNVIAKFHDEFEKIAEENNLSFVVSKWEIAYKNSSVELQDITMDLIKLFNPTEQTLNIAEEMQTKSPIPIEEAIIGLGDKHEH
jgi:hypothetical protein